MSTELSSKLGQLENFHKKHEQFTEKAYESGGVLPDRYVYVLTNLCNLKCSFCYQRKKPEKNTMQARDWMSLTDQIPEYARITLTGGEPLIFPEFRQIFAYIADKLDCNIITNGILLSEDVIDYILSFKNFKVLSISIDDIGNKHRGVRPSQWRHLVKMMKYFIKRRKQIESECILDIKTLILDNNADHLFDLYTFISENINPDTHVLQFLKGSTIQHADYMYEIKDIIKKNYAPVYKNISIIKDQLEQIRRYSVNTRRVGFLHPKVGSLVSGEQLKNIDIMNDKTHRKELFLPCKFPWSSTHINFDGTLFPCLAVSVGNVKNKPLDELINGSKFKSFRDIIRKEGTVEACNRCGWLKLKDEEITE